MEIFLLPHIRVLAQFYEVTVIADFSDSSYPELSQLDVNLVPIHIKRSIHVFADLKAFFLLALFFKNNKFDLIHSVTPKAGLLAISSAWLVGVPIRIHTFTGQVWATRYGVSRFILKLADRVLAILSTHILIDSPSQKDFLICNGIVKGHQSFVLGNGSISGVDISRFNLGGSKRGLAKSSLKIPQHSIVILYLGRLNHDKGLIELAKAFNLISNEISNLWLVLVGPDEEGMQAKVNSICLGNTARILHVGFTNRPEYFMNLADIFCLPSFREGFGSSVIEAAACGLPTIASRIYGLTDAVQDGVTGLLFTPGSVNELAGHIRTLAFNVRLRQEMGSAARTRAVQQFSQQRLVEAMLLFYRHALGEKN